MSALQRVREAFYCWRVRMLVDVELAEGGFSLVAPDLSLLGIASVPARGYDDAQIAAIWAKAEAAGKVNDEVMLDASTKAGITMSAVGDGGGLLDFFRRIIDWLSDPANQEKILNVVKFVMMLLALFGM